MTIADQRKHVLDWYDAHKRALPWREHLDPYRIWLSEVMSQQTTIAAVIPFYEKFLARWPTVHDLAAAPLDDVLGAWAGLGYYARARNLHKCAQAVSAMGGFPRDEAALRALPGVGAYTAAAIAAQAFGIETVAVDTNVERVFARLFMLEAQGPALKAAVAQAAMPYAIGERPGDFLQGLMELGGRVCKPKGPDCLLCPFFDVCAARKAGRQEDYPSKAVKAARPQRFGIVWLLTCQGELYLEQRPEKGLLGGFYAPPTSAWADAMPVAVPPVAADWQPIGSVRHVFTHFALDLDVCHAEAAAKPRLNGRWTRLERLELPTIFAKAVGMLTINTINLL